ncbi:MAG TPA: AI-2E family transporter [Candidatus Dormibacteraeota bacterium]|jgi:predicted PurR-regulated permease PerM
MVSSRGLNWVRALLVPLTILSWLALLIVTGWLLSHVTRALLLLILAGLLAFAASPIVNRLERFMPRVLAVSVTFVGGALLMAGFATVVVVAAADQVQQFVHNLPSYSDRIQSLQPRALNLLHHFGISSAQLNTFRENLVAYAQSIGSGVATGAVGLAASLANLIIEMVLILILSIYLTANSGRIAGWLREQAPADQRSHVELVISTVNRVVGGYVRGTLTMALFIGLLVGVGMQLMGVPYAVMLAALAFFMEFIPVIGVFISGAACAAVAATQGVGLALLVLGYFVIVHIIEGDVVGPRVMGRALGVHPAVALLALVAGGEVLGLWGALFGAPIAGLLQSFAAALWREIRGTRIETATASEPIILADDVATAASGPRHRPVEGK